ncbi:ABC transporter permease subunit, partial [Escherichia coli]|uniref:ABC transporter permease subunit n=1 Tax=Escherichia coli TaxID=562 RepID=UPI001961F00B
VPSIVIGVFAYALIVRSIGFSVIAAAFALAIIIIPIVTRTTEEALKLVPLSLREAAIALGVPRWKTVVTIVLRSAKKSSGYRDVAFYREDCWRICACACYNG